MNEESGVHACLRNYLPACLPACQEGYIRQLLFDILKDEPDVTFVEHHLDGPEDVLSVSEREFMD